MGNEPGPVQARQALPHGDTSLELHSQSLYLLFKNNSVEDLLFCFIFICTVRNTFFKIENGDLSSWELEAYVKNS